MRVVTKTVYKFNELSEDAQKKAIESFRTFNVDDINWYEFVYEAFIERMKEKGFNLSDDNISFTGFWSQGDGASFVCDDIDIEKLSKFIDKENNTDLGKYIRFLDNYSITVYRTDTHYCHYNTVSVHYDCSDMSGYNLVTEKFDTFYDRVLELVKDECKKLYEFLENEYNYKTSDEAIKESIEANEYEFDEDGTLFFDK